MSSRTTATAAPSSAEPVTASHWFIIGGRYHSRPLITQRTTNPTASSPVDAQKAAIPARRAQRRREAAAIIKRTSEPAKPIQSGAALWVLL